MKKDKSIHRPDGLKSAADAEPPGEGEDPGLEPRHEVLHELFHDEVPADLLELAGRIRLMPELEPPAGLLPSVMRSVRAKRLPWWRRFIHWVRSPRSLTFTPLQVALTVLFLVASTMLSAFYVMKGSVYPVRSDLAQTRAAVPVAFSLHLPGAHSVAVIGTFNEWHPQGYEMHAARNGDQVWTLILPLPDGRYEYSFLVDGKEIVPDPRAPFYQDDGFGNKNAVLIVGNDDEKAI